MSSTSTSLTPTISATGEGGCITHTPGKYGNVPPDACNSNYAYDPSFPAAVLFATLFGLGCGVHVVQAFVHRKRFSWVIIMGVLWLMISFILRAVGAHEQQNLGYVISSTLLFLLAPLWVNAYVYMVFGRMVYYYLPERKLFRIQAISIAKYFVWLDVVSFLVQGSGGSLISSEDAKTSRLGINIYMGGVGLQEFFILLFIGMTICFHRRVSQLIEQGQLDAGKNGAKKLVWTLYVVLGLITVRIIFRLVEFSSGVENNILIENETFIYVFDAVPMVFAAGLLNVIHPGRYLVGEESEFPPGLTRKEKKALKAEKKERKRWEKEERMRERGGKGRIASLFGGRKRGGDSTEDLDNRYRGGQAEEGRRGIPLEGRNGV